MDGRNFLVSVSCRPTSLCVAVDRSGNIVTSSHPTGGRRAWSVRKVAQASGFYGVSCPSVSLCVAVDDRGDVLSSQKPTGSASTWHVVHVKPGAALRAVSCPSVSLCVALDTAGDVITSTNPVGGVWETAHIENRNPLDIPAMVGISCRSGTLCVAVDGASSVLTSTNPTGGAGAWTVTRLSARRPSAFERLQAVSCPSLSMCVLGDSAGDALISTNPTDGAGAWIRAETEVFNGGLGVLGASCPSVSLCVLVDATGGVVVGESPASLATHVRAQLLKDLAPAGKPATITTLIKRGQYVLSFTVPTAGRLVSAWYYRANRNSRRVLVASGKRLVTTGGPARMTIRLTRTGKKLLGRSKRLILTTEGIFAPVGAPRIVARRSFRPTR